MCGFAGVLGCGAVDDAVLRRMGAAIAHRGPDDQGIWRDAQSFVGFAHARLAVIDLSPNGHQPMSSRSGRYVIAFNGEIYNHFELRDDLTETHWRGTSDTETLLAAFDKWGIQQTVKRIVGMFAFAVWDEERRELVLARDRFGEKPLYYGWQGSVFLFGSELSALRQHPAFGAEISRDDLAAFMRYGYVPTPRSIYHGISKLEPGSLLVIAAEARDRPLPERYWSLPTPDGYGSAATFQGDDNEAIDQLALKLSGAVAIQQISDVPIGAFLSGGIDSSLVVALMQSQAQRPIHTFTIGFDDQQYDESVSARAIAKHLGTHHTEFQVTAAEAQAVVPRLPRVYGEPFADSSQIPTLLVCELARRSVTVSLSGDGGDELFGGYNRHLWVRKLAAVPTSLRGVFAALLTTVSADRIDRIGSALWPLLPPSLRLRMPGDKAYKFAAALSARSAADIYRNLVSSWENPDQLVLGARESAVTAGLLVGGGQGRDLEQALMALDVLTYLPDDILCKIDRAAMSVSLETRVPFLDHRLAEFAWSLPTHMKIRQGQGKWVLRQLLYRYVPRHLVERPKMGFAVPVDAWLRGPLREWAEDLLAEGRLQYEGFLNAKLVRAKWDDHVHGKRNWTRQLWNVLMFQSWLAEQKAGV